MAEARQSLRAIFDEVSELAPGEQRRAYLDQACGDAAALRANIEELLRAQETAGGFLQDPQREACATVRVTEAEGDRIGRYKLLERVGEGGCGVVYVAEQTEPVRRRVALKLIKLGMDTKQVVARFEAERQALAMMDHPNIAKVLDGGTTETGRPFFVMELVRGIRITDYCDQNNLATRDRLDLFIRVCQAIQHAHQKGIIHRDIKPSNILVTLHDGVPVPKVIDFGIAKAMEGRLTDATVYTQLNQFIGTPAYMSPEQAEMSGLDIDTRSDIYSLGVLLYELLAGSTPFDARELMSKGIEAMRKTIREVEPPRPSTRFAKLAGEELTTTTRRRSTDKSRLMLQLKGDLDWVVMKCLEKDRTRRYETVNGLAADVKRHLGNEPVLARPPSRLYEFQKSVRRHKFGFATAAALVTVLAVGMLVSAREAARADREARRALQAEAVAKERLAESQAVSKFMTGVFQSPDPTRNGRTITVAETLDRAATNLDRELAAQPEMRAQLQVTLGQTYSSLGLYREAIPLQEKARDYYLKTLGSEQTATVGPMADLAASYSDAGRMDEGLKLREEALTLSRKVNGPEHPATLATMNNLAVSYFDAGRKDEALKLQKEVLTLDRKVLGPDHPHTLLAMNNLAVAYFDDGRKDEALKLREEVLTLSRKVNGPEHPATLLAINNLAISYSDAGRKDEALKLQKEVLTLDRKVLGPDHHQTLLAMNNLVNSYVDAGRKDEALKLREEVLMLDRKVFGPEHSNTLSAMKDLAASYFAAGRNAEALALLVKACEVDPKNTEASLTLATWQTWSGRDADYEATRRRVVQQAEGTDQASTAERAAKAYCLRPSTDEAMLTKVRQLAQQAMELGKSDPWLPYYQLGLGLAEYRSGHHAAAEQVLRVAEQTAGGFQDPKRIARLFRAMSLFRQDKTEEARKLLRRAEADMPPLPEDENKPLVDGKPVSHDMLILWLAYKEAKALMGDPPAPVAVPSLPK